jgi:hypothetical protein
MASRVGARQKEEIASLPEHFAEGGPLCSREEKPGFSEKPGFLTSVRALLIMRDLFGGEGERAGLPVDGWFWTSSENWMRLVSHIDESQNCPYLLLDE